MNARTAFLLVCFCLLTASEHVKAAFVNGIETFDGTELDTVTWIPAVPIGSSISQAEQLVMSGLGDSNTRYTTTVPVLSIGETVSVEVSSSSPAGGELSLVGDSGDVWSLWYAPARRIFFITQNGGGNGLSSQSAGLLNEYTLEFTRTSASEVQYRATSAGQELVTGFRSVAADLGDLFVSLRVTYNPGEVTFDNVRIVPEPSSAVLALTAAAGLIRVRKLSRF